MTIDIVQQLKNLSIAPTSKEDFDSWLQMRDVVNFLKANVSADEFVIYATTPLVFLHAVLVPNNEATTVKKGDFLDWNFNASSSWSVWTTLGEHPKASISPPLNDIRNKNFQGGEQLVFARFFEARLGNKSYYEILQKFVQISEIHFLSERNAYCRIQENGEIEDVVKIIQLPNKGGEFDITAVTFKRWALDQYAALTESTIIQTFDFKRYKQSNFTGWRNGASEKSEGGLIYRICIQPGDASYMRGVQIVKPKKSNDEVARDFAGIKVKEREHASFIAHDWKNKRIAQISCAPDQTADYFTSSDLPFELSPAFFRPDVLIKYKSDSDKYQIGDRSITCRGAWYLKGHDINEAGQVHAYICDLRHLPHEEQLHWKAYNESPRGGISKRAITTDFEGNWDLEYDPLVSLKEILREWRQKNIPWWTLRSENLINQVHYPVTTSADEWSNELLQLDQFVVEGFEKKWAEQQIKLLGKTVDAKLGALRCIEEFLIGLGLEADDARSLMSPFHVLHNLRSKLKGHANGDEALEIKREILSSCGSYKQHFRSLCTHIDESLKRIGEIFNAHISKIVSS